MGYEKHTVELSSGRVTYYVAGDGPPVLYLHPAGGLRLTRPLETLAKSFRILAPVSPGFDGSSMLGGIASMQELARLWGELVDQVIGTRCDVMGHSFGGWLAAWFTVLMPEKVGQLVLECPAGFREGGAGGLPDSPEAVQRALFAHPEKRPPETKSAEILARNREMLVHYHGGMPMDSALADRLGEIEVLTLILHGTKDGAIPAASMRFLKQRIQRAFLIFIYDAAHAIEVDQPEHFARLVDDFLKRGEAFLVNPGEGLAAE
jgi:pimeloyl-ACP methyl ester carboxylesterase